MRGDYRLRPWPIFLLSAVGFGLFFFNIVILTGVDVKGKISKIRVGGPKKNFPFFDPPDIIDEEAGLPDEIDQHPIVALTRDQLKQFEKIKRAQSKNFAQTVQKYRRKYGRHPPPKFDEWYKFAREKKVDNIDDFDRVMDDLRPFYGIPPADIRAMVKSLMDKDDSKVSIFRIRSQKVAETRRPDPAKAETLSKILGVIAKYLPDIDFAVNFLDEPRVIAPWDTVQEKLKLEKLTRMQPPESTNEFSKTEWDSGTLKSMPNLGFESYAGKPYMDLAAKACPPESYARRPEMDIKQVENTYKDPIGGFIRNFNLSSDLCTVGPTISQIHGFLFASSPIATTKLLPIFSESKVNVNNDILFPAVKYYDEKDELAYDAKKDVPWDEKNDLAVWRGSTIGGGQNADSYHRLHRHRFVALANGTKLGPDAKVTIMGAIDEDNTSGEYAQLYFHPFNYAEVNSDIGFSEIKGCDPDCKFLDGLVTKRPVLSMKDILKNKYLPDIDGVAYSGQWPAFLKSRSMAFKATIFKEWHSQRLFEWAHFAPMDNRFDDWYALLTYYTGLAKGAQGSDGAYVPRHDTEAKRMADRSREWANRVLRKEDIEVYMLRLLLEYSRVIDDNRDKLGYSGDGTEIDEAEKNKWWGP